MYGVSLYFQSIIIVNLWQGYVGCSMFRGLGITAPVAGSETKACRFFGRLASFLGKVGRLFPESGPSFSKGYLPCFFINSIKRLFISYVL